MAPTQVNGDVQGQALKSTGHSNQATNNPTQVKGDVQKQPLQFNGYSIQQATDKIVLIEYRFRKAYKIWPSWAEDYLQQTYDYIKAGNNKPMTTSFSEGEMLEKRLEQFLHPINIPLQVEKGKKARKNLVMCGGSHENTKEQLEFLMVQGSGVDVRVVFDWLFENRRVDGEEFDVEEVCPVKFLSFKEIMRLRREEAEKRGEEGSTEEEGTDETDEGSK